MRRLILALLAAAATGCGGATATTSGVESASQTGAIGTLVRHAVPAALRRLPLINQDGRRVTLASVLHRLQKFFGFYFQKVPEDDADARDWWTGKLLTYDVDHSDNYFVIDPAGAERVIQAAAPDFHGKLNPRLYKFLDELGRRHLKHPPQPDWTPADVLGALAVSVGRPLPQPAS